jgi:acyl carrier protein
MINYSKEIRDFIVAKLLFGDSTTLKDDASFLDSGVVDSTGMLDLITFVEEKYRIKVADEEMIPENFDSVERLNRFVLKKLGDRELTRI